MKLQSDRLYSKAAIEFMKANRMHEDDIDLEASLESYLFEMEKGLRGKAMLPMVPTYIHGDIAPARGKYALAVDVGGTNLRLALVRLDKLRRVRLSRMKKAPLPGLAGPVESAEFFDILAGHIVPYLAHTNLVSFSFAHEIHHMSNLDGKVMALSKELTVNGIQGKMLGEELKTALAQRGCGEARVIVLNDTVGVAGCMADRFDDYDSFIGLVMGTGTNTCYIEETKNIGKVSDAQERCMFINVESAEFDPISRGELDHVLDKTTDAPGTAPLEKMISGRYVGNLFWLTVKQAAIDGLLSKELKKTISSGAMMDTITMSGFLSDPYEGEYSNMCASDSDRAFLYTAAETIVRRGAKLIALEIAGAALKTGKGTSSERPICVIAEGTTYYTLKGLKRGIERLMNEWLREKGVYVSIKKIDNAALKGIGLIGLSYL